jgi:hypothetical protein
MKKRKYDMDKTVRTLCDRLLKSKTGSLNLREEERKLYSKRLRYKKRK